MAREGQGYPCFQRDMMMIIYIYIHIYIYIYIFVYVYVCVSLNESFVTLKQTYTGSPMNKETPILLKLNQNYLLNKIFDHYFIILLPLTIFVTCYF